MKPGLLKENILDVCTHEAACATGSKERGWSNTNSDDAAFLKVAWAARISFSAKGCQNDVSELNSGRDGNVILNQFDFKFGGEKGSLSILC